MASHFYRIHTSTTDNWTSKFSQSIVFLCSQDYLQVTRFNCSKNHVSQFVQYLALLWNTVFVSDKARFVGLFIGPAYFVRVDWIYWSQLIYYFIYIKKMTSKSRKEAWFFKVNYKLICPRYFELFVCLINRVLKKFKIKFL